MSARKDTDKAIVTNSEAVSVKFDKSQLDSSISAIVKIAGQQHMAYKGLKIECQKIHAEVGQELIFNDVWLYLHQTKQNLKGFSWKAGCC